MFNEENIKKLEYIYDKITTARLRVTNEFANALEASKDKDFTIVRNGKEVTAKGADLWYEVQNLGRECPAGEVLKPIYPDVFKYSEEHDKLLEELNIFSRAELEIDPLNITLLDIVRIAKGVFNGLK